jgi:hypothetical protein
MELQQFLDELTVPLICFVLPGILFIANGIRTMKSKTRLSVGTDPHFRWKKPFILKGKTAIEEGRRDIIFGSVLLLIGLSPVLGRLL